MLGSQKEAEETRAGVLQDPDSFGVVAREKSVDIRVVRIFNTYGEKMQINDGRVISNFIVQALKNEDITIHGDGKQSRDLTYVSDAVDAFLLVSKSQRCVRKIINFGTGTDFTINFLAREIKRISKSKSKIVHIERRKAEVQRLTCDAKLCKALGWRHKVDIKSGLKLNILWAKKNWF